MKKTLQYLLLFLLFCASFVLFLFVTFPYEVLKESLAAEMSQATGYAVSIGDMSPSLPLGVKAENIKLDAPSGTATLTLSSLSVDINPFMVLLGKLKVNAEVKSGTGAMDVGLDFGLFDLIRGAGSGAVVPNHFLFTAKAFPLDQIAQFGINVVTSGPSANPMVAPLLSAMGISAQLTGKMDFALDSHNPTQSTGDAELKLEKAVLKLSAPALGLPDQKFKKAQLKMKVDAGNVVFDKSSGFISDELELIPDGKIQLKQAPMASVLDLKVVVKLNAGLKEKFGFLIDAVTGSATSEGQLTMQVRGPMEQPAVTTF
jgi:hypothetical protein